MRDPRFQDVTKKGTISPCYDHDNDVQETTNDEKRVLSVPLLKDDLEAGQDVQDVGRTTTSDFDQSHWSSVVLRRGILISGLGLVSLIGLVGWLACDGTRSSSGGQRFSLQGFKGQDTRFPSHIGYAGPTPSK